MNWGTALAHQKDLFDRLTAQMIGVYALQCVEHFRKSLKAHSLVRHPKSLGLLHVRERSGMMGFSGDQGRGFNMNDKGPYQRGLHTIVT